jgi:tetratricopeptide (TPR) repeat protein
MMEEQDQTQNGITEEGRSWSPARVFGLILIIVAVLLALYVLIGYAAWERGQAIRSEREEIQLAEQFDRQVSLAQDDINQGNYALALHRLEWILERDPQNADAQAVKRQAEAALKTALTPEAPPTATPELEPSPMPGVVEEPEVEFQRLVRLAEIERWDDLLDSALAFQRQYPNYERLETDRFLYDSYLNLGLELIQGDQIEMGINYFAQAEKLGDLPQEALDYWLWAELYLQGMGYYGVNWGVASSFFRDVCLSAPFYQGSCAKLVESLTAYGDQFLLAQDYCPAVDLFQEARQRSRGSEISEKLEEAIQGCAEATPTPVSISDTVPITGVESIVPPGINE